MEIRSYLAKAKMAATRRITESTQRVTDKIISTALSDSPSAGKKSEN